MNNTSELSDKDIMANTIVERQDSSGRIRFRTTLPSGRPLESEFFQESAKTTGAIKWCEAVRGNVQGDIEEDNARRKREVAEQRAARAADLASAPTVMQEFNGTIPLAGRQSTASATSAAQSLSSDPNAFVQQQVQTAQTAVEHWRSQAALATARWQEALADLKKWTAINDSILGSGNTSAKGTDSSSGA